MKRINTSQPCEKRFQYSKLLVLASCAIFITTLIYCLLRDFSCVYDASVYITAISITGGVFGSSIVWYEKKAQAENVSKMQLQHIKDIAEIELDIYSRKVRLQKELGILGLPDIGMDDENVFHVDEHMSEAIDRDHNYLNTKLDDSTSEPEIQVYG